MATEPVLSSDFSKTFNEDYTACPACKVVLAIPYSCKTAWCIHCDTILESVPGGMGKFIRKQVLEEWIPYS